ncbi:hypothetical protein [Psychromonas sp. Urea-02u-13]|uniref:hypothetical protein n=1 Tax=Psychromonas sp. Urea-02u-13 TaxID=2058326 RepID=UPI0012FEE2DC|nr:hypothetical protein [Psychromonas sp. Urea-02u-13]
MTISVLAFGLYCLASFIVANCLIMDYCSFNISKNEAVSTVTTTETETDDIGQTDPQAMYDSYIANIYDTSIFFIVVTLAIAIFGFVKPEDEVFERKLTYLFPDLHRSEEGKQYVSQKINKMAAISPFSRHTVSFDEVIPLEDDSYLFKCGGIYEAQISNLHGNNSYKDDSVKISFALEQIEIDEIKNATNDFKWGQVTMLRTYSDKSSEDPMPWHNGKSRNFVNKLHSYDIKKLEIPAQESINIDVHSWTWSKFAKNKYDHFSVQRFTESIELYFINNLADKKLKVTYCVASEEDNIDLLINDDGDFSDGKELEISGHKDCRFQKQVKFFRPDQVIVWKVRVIT